VRVRHSMVATVLILLGCTRVFEQSIFEPVRGIILISIDTLRSDHLGSYGYSRDTSPNLDRFANRSVVFENAFAQLPGTLPSHMTIFTGLYPAEHGVYPPGSILSQRIRTLPEVFAEQGFRTGGFTEGGYVSGEYGFARGFSSFSDEATGGARDAEVTFERAEAFLGSVRDDERFFLFVHTYSVHDPYAPPEPFASRYWKEDPPGDAFRPTGPNFSAFNRKVERAVSSEAVKYFEARYDGGIRYLDSVLGTFLAYIEREGLLETSAVVITSDHGEEFYEHGRFAHEQAYRELIQVPLIVRIPRLEPRRVEGVVELVDLAPTLTELAGIRMTGVFSGDSLLPILATVPESPRVSSALVEGHVDPSQSIVTASEGGLHQLIEFRPSGDGWHGKRVDFDSVRSGVSFESLSYHEPRSLEVRVDGKRSSVHQIRPDKWTRIGVTFPHGWKHRVTLLADSCHSPQELGLSEDGRCLGFRIRGAATRRLELYDLRNDPLSQHDLSAIEIDRARELLRELNSRDFALAAPPASDEVSPELEQRLKALGYLQ